MRRMIAGLQEAPNVSLMPDNSLDATTVAPYR